MPDQSATPDRLTHQEAVRRLNATITQIHEAREVCHNRLRRAVRIPDAERALDDALAAADAYGMGLAVHFETLIELKLLYPAAWEESEGGQGQRAMEAAIQQMVVDSLALVFGFGWPSEGETRRGQDA